MKVKELIERLRKLDGDIEVAILDGFNGAGRSRTINFGPLVFSGQPNFKGDEWADYSDLDTPETHPIVIMGYGCY